MNKIRKITFKDHPILGNLTLDFCDENGNAVDTVIFAGENGAGKSTILNAIYQSITESLKRVVRIEWESNKSKHFVNINLNSNSIIGIDDMGRRISGGISLSSFNDAKGIFSDVDINFHTDAIIAVTSENIDMKKNSRRSNANSTKQINQLLIDVQALDDADVSKAFRSARENHQDTNVLEVPERMSRFKQAFSTMFENMTYDRVENQNGHKSIIFKKNSKDIPIEALSSGEKQIVYRGCFLLKDANALNGAFVFIDEPEISLHPNWQKKILDYYKGIFTDENGVQTSQIFVVTHSPFIIHNEKRKNDKVIVIARDEQGNVIVKDKAEYYKCNSLELIQDAFSIKDFSAEKSTVYLEGRTDELYFKKAVEIFGYDNIPFEFKWIGYLDDNGQEVNTGKDSLNKAVPFLIARNLPVKNVCLFDCDTKRTETDKNNVYTRVIPQYANSKKMKKGIENALVLDSIDTAPFYLERTEEGDYGDDRVRKEFQKMKFCKYICDLDSKTLKTVFSNLKTEIDSLIALFQGDEA